MNAVAAFRLSERVAFGLLAALLGVLAGCAAPPPAAEVPIGSGAPNLWSGRFAVTFTEGGYQPRTERSSGRFLLRTRGDRKQLELSSPLGQTMAQVTLEPGHATLVTSDGDVHEAESAEALTERVFGWRVPIGNLPAWLAGRVANPTERNGTQIVAGREQGWAVRFESFENERPNRVALHWPVDGGDGMRRLELRLIVDNAVHVAAISASR